MRVRRLEGRSSVLGRVRVRLPAGLVAVAGSDHRSRAAFLRLLRRSLAGRGGAPGPGREAEPSRYRPLPAGVLADDLTDLRLGVGLGEEPGEVLRAAVSALARLRGVARIDEAVARLRRGSEAGPRAPGEAIETLAREERHLRQLRADHAELAGEVEVATMEWLRERQDAETHLQAYRDRARELKAGLTRLEDGGPDAPCPTCRRVLGSHLDVVVEELREEWESVVQDGRWWKRRREQLDLKPLALRELEGRSLRLQAATEECAERVERARIWKAEEERSRGAVGAPGSETVAASSPGTSSDVAGRLLKGLTTLREEILGEARDQILAEGSRILLRASGGRLLAVAAGDPEDAVVLEGAEGPVPDPTGGDEAAAAISLRLSAALALGDTEGGDVLVVGDPFDDADEETRLRFLDVLVELSAGIPQILLVTRGDIVDLCPEAFDGVVELDASGPGGRRGVRSLPGGIGWLRLS